VRRRTNEIVKQDFELLVPFILAEKLNFRLKVLVLMVGNLHNNGRARPHSVGGEDRSLTQQGIEERTLPSFGARRRKREMRTRVT